MALHLDNVSGDVPTKIIHQPRQFSMDKRRQTGVEILHLVGVKDESGRITRRQIQNHAADAPVRVPRRFLALDGAIIVVVAVRQIAKLHVWSMHSP